MQKKKKRTLIYVTKCSHTTDCLLKSTNNKYFIPYDENIMDSHLIKQTQSYTWKLLAH